MSTGPRPDLQQLWGIVNRAVRDPELRARPGGVVQNVWESYKQAYVSVGLPPPRVGLQEVNKLVATASAQVRAERSLASSIEITRRTGLAQGITSAHIGPDIDTRAGVAGTAGATFRVRFESRIGVEGTEVKRYLTWTPALSLPTTTTDLLAALDEAAAAAAEDYGEDYAGLGDLVSITAV